MKTIGVVVIGKNEGIRLKRCLESLVDIADATVYVDSQSSDSSAELAASMGFHVIVLDDSKPVSRPRARNEGFNFLKSIYPEMQFVHFQDGDTIMSEGWLNAAHKKFMEERDAAIVCGQLQEKDRDISVYRKLFDIEWYREPGEAHVTGGNATIRVEAFERIGGYNESIRGEDFELCRRLRKSGWKIFCLGEQMGTHDSGMDTFNQYWQRGIKGGYAYLNSEHYGQFSKERISIIAWCVLLPFSILTLLFIKPMWGLILLMIYPVKVLQIAYRNKRRARVFGNAVIYGISCITIKYAELYGMLKFKFSRRKILSD
ncbi:MAG: glycosyltransferase family 2 protein [Sulfuricaulis sp.]